MRPIEKGDGTQYTQNKPANFDFSKYGNNKKALIQHYFNNQLIIPTANCLTFWLNVVKAGIQEIKVGDRTPDQKNRLIVKNMILDKVTAVYKTAGIPMVQTIGDFCCYCDTPIPGLLEVEHRCPKAEYPTFSMDWENFLMSCGPCNNAKSDNPDRALVRTWMDNPPPDPPEDDYKTEIEHRYAWADIDGNPYQYIVPYLYYDHNGIFTPVPINALYNLNNMIVSYDLATRVIRANLYDTNNQENQNVSVLVYEAKLSTDTQTKIINLCKLNYPGNPDSTYDRRMFNRTKAWFTVLASLKPISLIDFSGPQGQTLFNLLWQSVLITAVSTGFFSVWYQILKEMKDPSGANLGKRFVLETKHQNAFPATNTSFVN